MARHRSQPRPARVISEDSVRSTNVWLDEDGCVVRIDIALTPPSRPSATM